MLWVPLCGDHATVHNMSLVGDTTPGTAVQSGASSNGKGSVVQLISAANNIVDAWGIYIAIRNTGSASTARQARIEILAGDATEEVLIPGLICGYTTLQPAIREFFFPLHIPAGTRISATHANVTASVTAGVVCMLFGGGVPPFRVGRKVTAYGTPINDARGQAVTPTASGGTASVTQFTAGTAEDHFYFLPGFQPATDTSIQTSGHKIGIGIGAATEQRIGTWAFLSNNSESMGGPTPMFGAFKHVPAGTRLTFLASNSGSNDAAYDGLIYAVS
jgi:hypothetical protein